MTELFDRLSLGECGYCDDAGCRLARHSHAVGDLGADPIDDREGQGAEHIGIVGRYMHVAYTSVPEMSRIGRAQALRLAGLLTVLWLVAGCASAADPTAAPAASSRSTPEAGPIATPAVPGMRALAIRLRTDLAVGGQFQTRITNTGSEPFKVVAVSLDSPGFQRLPFAGRLAMFNPGATIDLPTRYGEVVCGEDIGVDPVFAAVQLQRPDGAIEEVRIPLEAPDDIIDIIHSEECHALALAATVDVSLGGDFTTTEVDGQTVVEATITLTRRDNTEEITLSELRGSVVLYLLFADEDASAAMPSDESQLEVPILFSITARTCDGHVLSETKQPFLFPFWLTFDGGDPQYGILDVSPEQRDLLWAYIREVCALD